MSTNARVLIVDDDTSLLKLLALRLESENYQVITSIDVNDGLAQLENNSIDVIITDLRMEPTNGMEFLKQLQVDYPEIPVIMLTAHGSIPDAVAATKQGVFAFLTKPIDKQKLFSSLQQAIFVHGKNDVNDARLAQPSPTGEMSESLFPGVITRSKSMLQLLQQIKRLAHTDVNILICGESGTGKELLAQTVHFYRRSAEASFVPINCGAVPAELLESELFGHKKGAFTGAIREHTGIFEKANGGSLFLDEIGDMPLALQVKLLRVLQERTIRPVGSNQEIPIDAHIISATHRDLNQSIIDKTFREDLFYRLNVVNLNLPPLRERREDIPLLAKYFAQKILLRANQPAAKYPPHMHFSPEALQMLVEHQWPGNIRELQNLIEQVVALNPGEFITENQIHLALGNNENKQLYKRSLSDAKRQFEKDYLLEKLSLALGNVAEAAKLAGRNRSDFYKLLKKHDIPIENLKDS